MLTEYSPKEPLIMYFVMVISSIDGAIVLDARSSIVILRFPYLRFVWISSFVQLESRMTKNTRIRIKVRFIYWISPPNMYEISHNFMRRTIIFGIDRYKMAFSRGILVILCILMVEFVGKRLGFCILSIPEYLFII